MNKRKAQMLKPVSVSPVQAVVSKSGKNEKLQGCKFTVVYDGVALANRGTLSRMGLYSGGRGSKYTGLEIISGQGVHQTTVEYFFKNGVFYPEPFARANKLHDALQGAVKNFVPREHPVIKADLKYDLFGESYIKAYHVVVRYSHAARQNPLFHDFITNGMPDVAKVVANSLGVDVVYVFENKNNAQAAYNSAMDFKSVLLVQMDCQQKN